MASALQVINDCCSPCDGQTYTVTQGGGGVSSTGFVVVDLLVDLRNVASAATNAFAWVKDALAVGDGNGGAYTWEAAALDADDGINWILPNDTVIGDPGRWKKRI